MTSKSKRFGMLALERGFITQEQLLMAMNIQIQEDIEQGNHRRIGKILCELGLMSASQTEDLLDIMRAWRG